MGKDQNLLKSVSDFFTEETLKEIVAKDKNLDSAEIKIDSWDFGEATGKGDNYLSEVSKVLVVSRVKNEKFSTKIVVKSLPKNPGRKKTFRSAEFFRNEIIFYSEIIPKFEAFLKSKNQSQLLRIPKCLAFKLDGENDFIALQDVSQFGFGPISRHNVITYEQFKYMVEAMARFHSVSLGFKLEKPAEFDRLTSRLSETYFTDHLYDTWYKGFHTKILLRIAKDALSKEYPGSEAEKKFNSYAPGELFKRCVDICSRKNAKSSVIGQGDSWVPNFLVRHSNSGKSEALILDFQLARCASLVLDLVFFVYASSDKPLRDLYYDQILKDYYAELSKSAKSLGCDLSKDYPWEEFSKEVKDQSVYGLVFALEAIPVSMMSTDQAFDMDSIDGDQVVDIEDIWVIDNISIPENRRRHADMIVHAVENGFI